MFLIRAVRKTFFSSNLCGLTLKIINYILKLIRRQKLSLVVLMSAEKTAIMHLLLESKARGIHLCWLLLWSLYIACSRREFTGLILHAHPARGETHIQYRAYRVVANCNNAPPFYNEQRTAPIEHSFSGGYIWHGFHLMITASFCCDRKAGAASAQSFTFSLFAWHV